MKEPKKHRVLKGLLGEVVPKKLGRPRHIATLNMGKGHRQVIDMSDYMRTLKVRFGKMMKK